MTFCATVEIGELTGCDVIKKTSGQPDARSRKVREPREIACDLVGVAFVGDSPQCCSAARKQGNAVVCARQTDLDGLLPMEFFPEDHLLMVLKGYFDGGRDTHDKQITLATVCGTSEQWRSFCPAWKTVLDQHKAPPLHTTDAVALEGDFSESKGWNKTSVDVLIGECVDVIAAHIHNPLVVTLSVRFDDYRRAREVVPALPNSVYEICATESVSFCFNWGRAIGANWYHLYFDQGEPFFGHVHDRMHHPKARRAIPLMKRVAALSELNMRFSPALPIYPSTEWNVYVMNGRIESQQVARNYLC